MGDSLPGLKGDTKLAASPLKVSREDAFLGFFSCDASISVLVLSAGLLAVLSALFGVEIGFGSGTLVVGDSRSLSCFCSSTDRVVMSLLSVNVNKKEIK